MSLKQPNKADIMTFRALQRALEEKRLELYINDKTLNKPGTPTYSPWEFLLPRLVPILLGLFLLYFSIIFGLIIIVGSVLVSEKIINKKFKNVFYERTKKYVLESFENFDKMWKIGGIILVEKGSKKNSCLSPKADWKEFIVKNFSDLMIEKKEEPKEEVSDPNENKITSRRRR